MTVEQNYWTRRRVTRRTALRGAGIGVAGLAGAALIGCGGGGDEGGGAGGGESSSATAAAQQEAAGQITGGTATAAATEAAGATPVPADQVRIPAGVYLEPIPPTPAEANPLVNGRYGGTLLARYLDPPRMDINRTLSCTIYTTMQYTHNKVTRGKVGAAAHPFLVEIEPDLAESWEASPDGTEFTFHLRKGVKTHNVDPTNGREFTSEDIKLAMERYQAGGTQQDVYAPVTSFETSDDYTLKISLDQPLADFPTNIAAWSFMWPREMIEGNDPLVEGRAVGTGPFIQDEWTKKERSVFVKHPDYFEEGLPFLDKVIAFVQNDSAARRAGFRTNNFFDWSALDLDELKSGYEEDKDDYVGYRYPISRGANVNGWHFQMLNPKFQDERVRRAFSLAFDRDEYDLARNGGDNQNPNGAFSLPPMPWILLYDEYPDQRANGQYYRFDPEQASQLMQAAGYSADNPLEWEHVTWYDRSPSSEQIIPGVTNVLPSMKISFRQVDNPTQVTLLSDRNFEDTIGIVWGPAGFSMDQWIFPWYHTKGGLNYNAAGNPELDTILEKQRASADPAEKTELWRQVWETIHDQVWDIWWPQGWADVAWHNYVLNYRSHGWMGSMACYTADQARAMWLDEGHKMAGQ